MKLSQIRKALWAAVPPLLPLLAYACSVPPASGMKLGYIIYVAIVGELGALGVYAVTNEPAVAAENAADEASAVSFTGAADQVVPPPV